MTNALQTIFRSKPIRVAYSDIHCHVLPGLDDGPKTDSAAVDLVRKAQSCGARRIVATPHFLPGVFEPSPEDIHSRVTTLTGQLASQGICVEILPGCEAYLSERLCSDVRDGRILPLGHGSHVLVELPAMMLPQGFAEELFALRTMGAGVVLAHPERSMELRRNRELVRQFVEMGILLQVNAGSIVGVHGKEAASFASRLLEEEMAHFVASDAHSGSSADLRAGGPDIRPALRKAFRSDSLAKRFLKQAEERFEEIVMGRV